MITRLSPHPCLDKIVSYYWVERNGKGSVKVLPDGTTSILFNLGDPINLYGIDNDYEGITNNVIVGSQKKYFIVEEKKNTHIIGVKFTQGGGFHFFKLPMSKFSNKVIELSDIIDDESEKLRQLLQKAESPEAVKKVLDYYLLIHADMLSGTSKIVDYAIKRVNADDSPSLIKELCENANISNKHLISLFNKKVGQTPKLIQRLNKFKKVINIINKQRVINWPQVAYECNYYDQAHLINEFKIFAGVSPSNYLEDIRKNRVKVMD